MWGGSIPSNLAFTRSPLIQTIFLNTRLLYYPISNTHDIHFIPHYSLAHRQVNITSVHPPNSYHTAPYSTPCRKSPPSNPFSLSSHISAVLWMLPRCIDLKAVNFQLGLKGQTVQGGLRDAHLWIWRKNYFEKYEKCIKEGLRDPHRWIKRDFFAWSLNERERTLVYMQTLR